MKNLTLNTAIKLGFDYENSIFESKEDLDQLVIDYLSENTAKLPKLKDYCEVISHGRGQHVNFGNYSCSGEIMQYDIYGRRHRVYHSNFLYIDEQGKCFEQLLWDYSK